MLLSGHLQWTDIVWDPNALFISLGYMVLIAFSEELVFRGYILGNLLETFSNKWIALGISAVLFTGYHFPSPGIHALAFFNLFLAGLLLGLNYIYTKNLWFSFMLHLSWNFFEGPLLGFRVSGISFPSLLQAEPKGDLMITGGDFGAEGSMLMMLLLLTAILVLAWAFQRKYGAPHTPPGPARGRVFQYHPFLERSALSGPRNNHNAPLTRCIHTHRRTQTRRLRAVRTPRPHTPRSTQLRTVTVLRIKA